MRRTTVDSTTGWWCGRFVTAHTVWRCVAVIGICLVGDSSFLQSQCTAQAQSSNSTNASRTALLVLSPKLCSCLVDSITHGLISLAVLFRWPRVGNAMMKDSDSTYWTLHAAFVYACGVVVDVDHFLTAKSWSLSSATHLRGRPIGHCFTVLVFVGVCSYMLESSLSRCTNRDDDENNNDDDDDDERQREFSTTPAVSASLPHASMTLLQKCCRYCVHWKHRLAGNVDGGAGLMCSYFLVFAVFLHQLRDSWRRGLWLCPLGVSLHVPYGAYVLISAASVLVHDVAVARSSCRSRRRWCWGWHGCQQRCWWPIQRVVLVGSRRSRRAAAAESVALV